MKNRKCQGTGKIDYSKVMSTNTEVTTLSHRVRIKKRCTSTVAVHWGKVNIVEAGTAALKNDLNN